MRLTTDLRISGTGMYLPPPESVHDAIERGDYDADCVDLDGVEEVGVERELTPADMAARAVNDAIRQAGATEVPMDLLLHSCLDHQGPAFWDAAPRVALNSVGAHVPALDVRQACNGALGSLWLLANMDLPQGHGAIISTADRFDRPGLNRWRGDQSIFGDGGTAAVVERGRGFARVLSIVTLAENSLDGECYSYPGEVAEVGIDFDRRREYFHTHQVSMVDHYTIMQSVIQRGVDQALAEGGAAVEQIRWFLPVISTRWRMQIQLSRFLGATLDRSSWELGKRTGHMGSGDQIAGLNWLTNNGLIECGDKVLLLGGGTGFTLTVAVLEIVDGVR